MTADFKKQTKAVNDEKKAILTALDDLRDRARKPLDEWEAAENAREAKIKETLEKVGAKVELK